MGDSDVKVEAVALSAALVLRACCYIKPPSQQPQQPQPQPTSQVVPSRPVPPPPPSSPPQTQGEGQRRQRRQQQQQTGAACWQSVAKWLTGTAADPSRTLEVLASGGNDDAHMALARWLGVVARHLMAIQVGDTPRSREKPRACHPQTWVTISEKKLKFHFEKTRQVVQSWGAGAVRKWHLRAAVTGYLEERVKAAAKTGGGAGAEGDTCNTTLGAALQEAEPERHGSEGLVALHWPAAEPEPEPQPPNPKRSTETVLPLRTRTVAAAEELRHLLLRGCGSDLQLGRVLATLNKLAQQVQPRPVVTPAAAPMSTAVAMPHTHAHGHGLGQQGQSWHSLLHAHGPACPHVPNIRFEDTHGAQWLGFTGMFLCVGCSCHESETQRPGSSDPLRRQAPRHRQRDGRAGEVRRAGRGGAGRPLLLRHAAAHLPLRLAHTTGAPRVVVSRAFPSWKRSVLTEIYLCHACSYHEIEDGNTRVGRPPSSAGRRSQRPPPPTTPPGPVRRCRRWRHRRQVGGQAVCLLPPPERDPSYDCAAVLTGMHQCGTCYLVTPHQ
jgi:hypothetical protein